MRSSKETGSLPRTTLQRTASERGLLRTATGGPGRPSPMAARARSQPHAEPDRRSRRRSLWGGRPTTNADNDQGATSSCLPSLRHQRAPPPPDFDGVPPEPDAGLPGPPRIRLNRLRGVHELDESLVQRQFEQLYNERNAVAAERGRCVNNSRNTPCALNPSNTKLPEREVSPLLPLSPRKTNVNNSNVKNVNSSEKKIATSSQISSRRRRMSQRIRHVFVRSSSNKENIKENAENVSPPSNKENRSRYSMRTRRRNESVDKTTLTNQRREAAAIEAARRRKRGPVVIERPQESLSPVQSRLANAARPPTGPVRHNSGMKAREASSSQLELSQPRTRSDACAPERTLGQLPRVRSACASAIFSESTLDLAEISAATVVSTESINAMYADVENEAVPKSGKMNWSPVSSGNCNRVAPLNTRQADRNCEQVLARRDSRKPFASIMNVEELERATRSPAPEPPKRGFEPVHGGGAWGSANGRTKSLRAFANKARGRVKSALGPLPPTHTPVVKGRWGRRNVSAAGN